MALKDIVDRLKNDIGALAPEIDKEKSEIKEKQNIVDQAELLRSIIAPQPKEKAKEQPAAPELSDEEIKTLLAKKGIKLADEEKKEKDGWF